MGVIHGHGRPCRSLGPRFRKGVACRSYSPPHWSARPARPLARAPAKAAPQREPTLAELFRPASLKGNATPRFWSGDNPIVVTMGALFTLGAFATVARENTALAIDGALLSAGLLFGVSRLGMK